MAGQGARIGAAAFALGLSLAGPQGVAAADSAEGGSPGVTAAADATPSSAGPARTKRGPAARGGRPAAASASPVRASATAAEQKKSSGPARRRALSDAGASRQSRGAASPTAAAPTGSAATLGAAVSAAADTEALSPATATVTASVAPAPASGSAAGTCWRCVASAAKTGAISAGGPVNASVRPAERLDSIAHWLSGLPSGPVTTFLSGALQLVRRNLFEDVPIVHVSDVTVSEASAEAVFTVMLDRPATSTLTVGYATTSGLNHPWAEAADLAARATAGADYQAAWGTLTFSPGQTSQQVVISCLDDHIAEASESFTLEILAMTAPRRTSPPAGAAVSSPSAAQVAADPTVSSVVLTSGTATIVDDERVRIDVNPNFAYSDALLASVFSNIAYDHRDSAAFGQEVQATGWQGIGVADGSLGANAYSPAAGGYGVQDGWSTQSYAFAGKRTAADGTLQFVVSFEGSNSPASEPADWINNAGQYGWSNYYASLEPLMTEVVGQMLQAQADQQKTQLILTGHSLGGAAAMMAFADLLAPQGDLWPNTSAVLAAGQRVLDTVGGWSPEVRTALLAATSVYTFGAPSILIEPTKPGIPDVAAFVKKLTSSGFWGALKVLADAVGGLSVDDRKLPDLTGIAGINFGTRVFQFEHANSSWLPPYPGDIVAQIGSRDPGTVLAVNLDNDIHTAYSGWLSFVPGGTHPISLYRESVVRLITNSRLLKNPNDLAANTPQLTRTAAGQGSDTRNDFFVNLSDVGKDGNDLFAYTRAGTYTADGGAGTDAYSISGYGITLTIDGSLQSGRDTLVFNVAGTPAAAYIGTGNDTAVFSVTAADGKSSSVKVTHWDQWQISDAFQVISPADGSWTLANLTIEGPVAVTPVDEVPLSVV